MIADIALSPEQEADRTLYSGLIRHLGAQGEIIAKLIMMPDRYSGIYTEESLAHYSRMLYAVCESLNLPQRALPPVVAQRITSVKMTAEQKMKIVDAYFANNPNSSNATATADLEATYNLFINERVLTSIRRRTGAYSKAKLASWEKIRLSGAVSKSISDMTRLEIWKDADAGMAFASIAERYGISEGQARYLSQARARFRATVPLARIEDDNADVPLDVVEQIQSQFDAGGINYRRLALMHGLPVRECIRICQRYGKYRPAIPAAQAEAIRKRYAEGPCDARDLAKEFGVPYRIVLAIHKGWGIYASP